MDPVASHQMQWQLAGWVPPTHSILSKSTMVLVRLWWSFVSSLSSLSLPLTWCSSEDILLLRNHKGTVWAGRWYARVGLCWWRVGYWLALGFEILCCRRDWRWRQHNYFFVCFQRRIENLPMLYRKLFLQFPAWMFTLVIHYSWIIKTGITNVLQFTEKLTRVTQTRWSW